RRRGLDGLPVVGVDVTVSIGVVVLRKCSGRGEDEGCDQRAVDHENSNDMALHLIQTPRSSATGSASNSAASLVDPVWRPSLISSDSNVPSGSSTEVS